MRQVKAVHGLALGMLLLLAVACPALAFGPDSLVWKKCTSCHAADSQGRIARVEEMRTTPEEWTVIVDRMRRLHGMTLGKGEMDTLLKELATTQLLAPEEQRKVAYLSLWHNAQTVEKPTNKEEERLFTVCVRCHAAGKILSYRMTPASWAKLRDFHLYAIPSVVLQMRELHWIEEADAVLAYLARTLPYERAVPRAAAKLAGDWTIFGHEPGRGTYRGQARITEGENSEYAVAGALDYADGTSETFRGEATLYGGYALRTRTRNNGFAVNGAFIVAGDSMTGEQHFPAPDFRTSAATWLRSDGVPKVARIVPGYVLAGERTKLVVQGVNLPDMDKASVKFGGAPVRVLGARRLDAHSLEVEVVSNVTAPVTAKVAIGDIPAGTIVLAPAIHHIVVTPALGRARLSGGRHYPAEGVQFEAIAYARQGSGKKAVDVALGPVMATFRLAEERTRAGDDDLRWLGAIRPNGTYLPTGDYGPNPSRKYSGENSGLVKVVADYSHRGRTHRAQGQLAVTMPDFIARLR